MLSGTLYNKITNKKSKYEKTYKTEQTKAAKANEANEKQEVKNLQSESVDEKTAEKLHLSEPSRT